MSLQLSLQKVIRNWNQMQGSGMDRAETDADRFEDSFYDFIDELKKWWESLKSQPSTLEAALEMSEIQLIVEQLPAPLYLNFETELDLIIEGTERIEEEKYD